MRPIRVAEIRLGKKKTHPEFSAVAKFVGRSKIDEPGGRRRAEEGDLEG
jgi:hypothetical protein